MLKEDQNFMSSSSRSYDSEDLFRKEVGFFFDTAPTLKDHASISKKLKRFIELNSHASGEL